MKINKGTLLEQLEIEKKLNEQLIKESSLLCSIIKKVDIKNIKFTTEECSLIDLIKGNKSWNG